MRVLHFLTQRPGWTGSGTTLHALVRWGRAQGIEQRVLCLVPAGEGIPSVGGLAEREVHMISCGAGAELPFPIPGMSDVMPYPSTVFGGMDTDQLRLYRQVLKSNLQRCLGEFDPDVIHVHHAWIGAGLVNGLAGETPVVMHGHGTGLRQMGLVPALKGPVCAALEGIAGVCVLHEQHGLAYGEVLGMNPDGIHVVGAGFDSGLFVPPAVPAGEGTLLFAGKWAESKGLGPLLEAFVQLRGERPRIRLAVAGAGSGEEAACLAQQMRGLEGVEVLGRLNPKEMAAAMGRAQILVLPSLYEGLPLVLVEAAASGCRLVSTDLPGVRSGLAGAMADRLHLVPMPALTGPDTLAQGERPGFVQGLIRALGEALDAGPAPPVAESTLDEFSWDAVAGRVYRVWDQVLMAKG